MDARKLREGSLQRYKSSLLSSKWKDCYGVLFSDSTLCLYNEQGDNRPAESIFLKNVVPYICVGLMTDRMPVKRPTLPDGVAIQRLVGIGMDPKAEKVHWILFPSENDLEIWFNEIVTTLPKPAQPPPQQPGQPMSGGQSQPSGSFVPPARYPDAPPPPVGNYGQGGYAQPQGGGGYAPPPPAYSGYGPGPQQPPPQPSHTTVIIDRGGGGGYGGGGYGGGGLSSGLGSGMGFGSGMLMGSLLGYGIGSFFTPHYSSFGGLGGGFGGFGSGMGGYSSGHGFGGGYVQDNDTYITNNYYNNDDNHSTTNVTNPEPVEDHTTTTHDTDHTDTNYDNYDYQPPAGGDGEDQPPPTSDENDDNYVIEPEEEGDGRDYPDEAQEEPVEYNVGEDNNDDTGGYDEGGADFGGDGGGEW